MITLSDPTHEGSVLIEAPVHSVFDFCLDPRRIFSGDPMKVADATLVPEGVGTTAHLTGSMLIFVQDVPIEYVEVVPDERIVYLIARTANHIREFRYRIRDDSVVEHDVVHPASTVMAADDLFTFSFYQYHDDFGTFVRGYETATAYAKAHPSLDDPEDRDDLLFMTAIPWVSFTSFSHPVLSIPVDSVPRFAWGRFYDRGGSLMMPLSVQGHHALMDGLHVGKYFQHYQDLLDNPDDYMTTTI